jgi:hypothetical protein
VISGGYMSWIWTRLKIQWNILDSFIDIKILMGTTQYLRKVIANLSIEAPLHSMNSKGNIFHWSKPKK